MDLEGGLKGGGRWSQNLSKLKNLMKKPLAAKDAEKKLYNVLGDDHLFDLISRVKSKSPNKNIFNDSEIKSFLKKELSPRKSARKPARKSPKSAKKSAKKRCPNGSRRSQSGKCVKK